MFKDKKTQEIAEIIDDLSASEKEIVLNFISGISSIENAQSRKKNSQTTIKRVAWLKKITEMAPWPEQEVKALIKNIEEQRKLWKV